MNSQLSANAPGGYTRRAIFVSPGNQNYQRQMESLLPPWESEGRSASLSKTAGRALWRCFKTLETQLGPESVFLGLILLDLRSPRAAIALLNSLLGLQAELPHRRGPRALVLLAAVFVPFRARVAGLAFRAVA